MSKLSFWLLLTIAALIYGCSQSTNPASSSGIFPLTEGNTWVYQISEFDSTNTLQWSYPDTVTVGKEVIIGTEAWHRIIHSATDIFSDTIWYSIRTDGLWERRYNYSLIPHTYSMAFKYKFPTAINDTFNLSMNKWPPSEPSRSFTRIVSTTELLQVPAGSFSCILYQNNLQPLDSATLQVISDIIGIEDYINSGIGLIKSAQSFLRQTGPTTFGHFRHETVLVSYSVH